MECSCKYCSLWCAGIIGGCLWGTRVVVFSVGQFQIHKVMFVFSPQNHPSEFLAKTFVCIPA